MPIQYTPTDVLHNAWWIGATGLIASLIATPIVRLIAYRTRVVDRPDDLLKPHDRPVAYLGGVAMCFGLLVGLGVYVTVMPDAGRHWSDLKVHLAGGRLGMLTDNPLWKLLAIAVSSLVVMTVGLIDDLRDIQPRTKVLGQALAAAVLLLGGVGIRMAKVVVYGIDVPAWILIPFSALMLMIVVIATCNASNLLDGLDGLCGGVTGIIALGFLALAVWLAMWGHFPGTDELRVALCLAMAGGVLGFLPYNIPPASIFMGDAGSMLLGFFVATMMALFCEEGTIRWLIAACAVFALPILDTALAVVRRVLSKKSIFAGDRSHLYDQLVDRGMTVKQVVGLFYALAAVAAGIGVAVAIFVRARYAIAVYAILLAVIWAGFHKLGMIRPQQQGQVEAEEPESSSEDS